MRTHTKIAALTIVLAASGMFAGCNQKVDEEPNVVLEVATMTVPPVTGTRDAASGACILTITNSTASFRNQPKNHLATTSPFNDIVLHDVFVTYAWDDGNGVTQAQFGVGGTIPAAGTGSAQFSIVNGQDLVLPQNRENHSASLQLFFRGVTVAGEAVSCSTGGTLTVNPCQ